MNLTNILKFNAITTLPFAILLLIFNKWVSVYLGNIENWMVIFVAIVLLMFSVSAWIISMKPNKLLASLINSLDISWVILTTLLVTIDPTQMSYLSKIIIFLINVVVVFNIYYQTKGIKQLTIKIE